MSSATLHGHDHHTPTGWKRWAYSTNHKDIGTMYLIFAIIAGVIGTAFSVLMRIELMHPGDGILGGNYLEGVARQPELQPMLLTQLFISLALVDAVPIIAVGISLYMIFAL